MLTNLHVKNLALIDEVEVEFGPGLNILTGETGAGKSIIIGSVNLALGRKMSKEMIRKGADSALIELVFQTGNPKVLDKLKEMEIEAADGQVIITRKLSEGRSISKINGETCTVSQVKNLAADLLDIHGQHEHQSLLYQDRQLEILDAYGREKTEPAKHAVNEAYQLYKKLKKELSQYQLDEEGRAREIAFLEFEIREIEEAALKTGEDEELERQYRRMFNAGKIADSLNQVHRMTGYEEGSGAGEQVGRALKELSGVSSCDTRLVELENILKDIDGILNDFNREISDYQAELVFSEEELYQAEKRLDEINHLKSKYGNSLEEIISYREKQSERLEQLLNYESRKSILSDKLKKAGETLQTVSHTLSEIRKSYSEKLEQEITEGLKDLNFEDIKFEILFLELDHYTKDGTDSIEFQISTNPGEQLKALAKVVSGGELSRIMLAIKTILADKDETETLIFDEIDTGISGRTAQKVSEKMAEIGKNHQVLCITHLPQIAAMADLHFEILKIVTGMETKTIIRRLSEEESISELARILGGARITKAVEENAKEMKELAGIQKTSRL